MAGRSFRVTHRGHWLQLRLRGRLSNRDGIGARIDVTANRRSMRRELRSAAGYCSASYLRAPGVGRIRADGPFAAAPSGNKLAVAMME